MCKFNKVAGLDGIWALELFKRGGVIAIWYDFNSQDDEIYKLLTYYNKVEIPSYISYFLSYTDLYLFFLFTGQF